MHDLAEGRRCRGSEIVAVIVCDNAFSCTRHDIDRTRGRLRNRPLPGKLALTPASPQQAHP